MTLSPQKGQIVHMPDIIEGQINEGAQMAGGAEPFLGLSPYTEESREVFFGRRPDTDALLSLLTRDDFSMGVLHGEAGVGKTSCLRAGLLPRLKSTGPAALYLSGKQTIRKDLEAAAMDAGATPSMPDEELATYALRVARALKDKPVLIIDNISDILEGEETKDSLHELMELVRRLGREDHAPLRILFCVDTERYHLLTDLQRSAQVSIPPSAIYRLKRFGRETATKVIEQAALASGVYFEAGLSALIAQDLTARGPVLPLTLQVTVSRAVEKNALFARRYLRQGGTAVLTLDWLKSRCAKARQSLAIPLLSEATDLREHGAGWSSIEELARGAGVSEDGAQKAAETLTLEGLFEKRTRGAVATFRLRQMGLISSIHRIDGSYRAKKSKARLTLRRRLTSGGLLRPHETLSTLGYRPRSPEESSLLSKSRKIHLLAVLIFFAVLAGTLTWVQFVAQSGYRVELMGSGPKEHRTLMVKRGLPGYSSFALYSPTPPLGAILVDTGIPGASLKKGAYKKISRGKLSGTWDSRVGGVPGWYDDLMKHLEPVLRGELLILGGAPKKGYALLEKRSRDPRELGRILSFLTLVGTGTPREKTLIKKGFDSKDRQLRVRALVCALGVARQNPNAVMEVLVAAAKSKLPTLRRQVLEGARHLPPAKALQMVSKAFAGLGENDELQTALALAWIFRDKAPREAADLFVKGLGRSSAAISRRSVEWLTVMKRNHPKKVGKALATGLSRYKKTSTRLELARLLASLPKGGRHTSSVEKAVLKLLQDKSFGVVKKGYELAYDLVDYDKVKDKIHSMAKKDKGKATRWRALAATALRHYAKRGANVDTDLLERLAKDRRVAVRVEAVKALGHTKKQLRVLSETLSDREIAVRAEAMVALAAQSGKNNYKTLTLLRKLAKGEGFAIKVAMPRAAANLVSSRRYWPIARYEVIRATRNRSSKIRTAAVEALAPIGHLRPKKALQALKKRVEDESASVRKATAKALAQVTPHLPIKKTIPLLIKLANDSDHPVAVTALRGIHTALSPTKKKTASKATKKPKAQDDKKEKRRSDSAAVLVGAAALKLLEKASGARHRLDAFLKVLAETPPEHHPKKLGQSLAKSFRTVTWDHAYTVLLDTTQRLKLGRPLLAAIEVGPPRIKKRALSAALKHSQETAAQALTIALQDPNEEVQQAAFKGAADLAVERHDKLLDLLLKRMADPSDPFAFRALEVLAGARIAAEKKKKKIVHTLTTATFSPYVAVRSAAARALAKNPKIYRKLLTRLLLDPAVEVRRHAIMGYATWLSEKTDAAKLVRQLDTKRARRQERYAALVALHLKRRGNEKDSAAEALDKAAKAPTPLTRVLARAALTVREGDTRRLMDLLELLFLL